MHLRPVFIGSILPLLFLFLMQAGCSTADTNPATVTPANLTPAVSEESPTPPRNPTSDIKSWGAWTIHCIDPTAETPASVKIIPFRDGEAHLDVTTMLRPPLCANCMGVSLVSQVGQDWTLEVTLVNPTVQTAYDVMGVFPGSNCPEIINPDSFTDLFDLDGFSDTHNPFKIFQTGTDNHAWGPGESHDQVFTFRREPGEKFVDLVYVVAASWPENQAEIVALINPQASGPLYTDTSQPVDFTVQVSDWQDDVEYVLINLEPVNGSAYAHMQSIGNGVYKYLSFAAWGLTGGTAATLMIAAKSLGADNLTYNFVKVDIMDPPLPVTNFVVACGPVSLTGPGTPSGELDLSVIGNPDGTSATFVNASPTDIYEWNESYSESDLLVSLLDSTGANPDFPIEPVSRIAIPIPIDPDSPDTFSILQTNLDQGIWSSSINPPVLFRNTLQVMDLETLKTIDFKLTADNAETPELDAILRPTDVPRGVTANKYGYAMWVPDGGTYPTYYPFVALVRYKPPYKDLAKEYTSLIGGIPAGSGDGKVVADDVNGLAVWDGGGDSNLIFAISEGGTAGQVELFSADYVSSPAGLLVPITTIDGLPGTPIDVAILPVADAGLESENWLCILTDSKTIETYTLSGQFIESFVDSSALPHVPRHLDVDVQNLRIHVMMDGPTATVIQYKGD